MLDRGGRLVRLVHVTTRSSDNQIIVASLGGGGTPPGIIGFSPATRVQSVIASGVLLVAPTGVTLDQSENMLVTDAHAFGGPGGVIRISGGGVQTEVSGGDLFVDPFDLAVYPAIP